MALLSWFLFQLMIRLGGFLAGRPGRPPARVAGGHARPAVRPPGACAREERGARDRGGKRGGRESSEAVPDLRFVSGKIRNLVISIVVVRELVNRYMNRILDLKIYLLNTSDLNIGLVRILRRFKKQLQYHRYIVFFNMFV